VEAPKFMGKLLIAQIKPKKWRTRHPGLDPGTIQIKRQWNKSKKPEKSSWSVSRLPELVRS
jgi:hypothetical protein